MTNVIDFTRFLEEKNKTRAVIEEGKSLLKHRSDFAITVVNDLVTTLSDAERQDTAIYEINQIFKAVFEAEKFKETIGHSLGFLWFDIALRHFTEAEGAYMRLYNCWSDPTTPEKTLTVAGLFTKESLLKTMGPAAVPAWTSPEPLSVTDVQEIRRIIFDYIQTHPDVDTSRDLGSGNLSTIAYQAVGELVDRGYSLSDYDYTCSHHAKGKTSLGRLLMLFTKGEQELYFYFDFEAALRVCELFLKGYYDID